MDFQNLLMKKEGNVGILSFNRPKVLNALNTSVLQELEEAIDQIHKDYNSYLNDS